MLSFRRFSILFFAFLLQFACIARAEDWSVRLRLAEPTLEDWAAAMRALGDGDERELVRDAVFETEEFPRAELVGLLEHETLAVRLGALGLLEEARGGDEGFQPFYKPGDDRNSESLAQWNSWIESDSPIQEGATSADLEKQQRYLRELMSDDRDRAQRARRGLKRDGLSAVALIETFIQENQGLPVGEKARLREAQYDIVLAESMGESSRQLARDLVFGNRDQRLAALGTVREAGPLAIPILRQFIDSEDVLEREATLDSLLAAGRSKVFPLVKEVMTEEKDVNVLHGAIRRLKDIPGTATSELLMPLMEHPDEDVLTSAMSALSNLIGGNDNYSSFGRKKTASPQREEFEKKILPLLEDSRWRVRAAALECVGNLKSAAARAQVAELLSDEDEFVSFRAIEAAVKLGGPKLEGKLKEIFMKSDDLIVPVLAGYSSLEKAPDSEMVAHLRTREPDLIMSGLAALEDDASSIVGVIASFAEGENLDIACAALRRLAKDDDLVKTDRVASILVRALRSEEEAKVNAVLDSLKMPNERVKQGLSKASRQYSPAEPTSLDGLYEALLRKPTPTAKDPEAPVAIPDEEFPLVALSSELAEIGKENTPNGFEAALQLTRFGDARGSELLLEKFPGMSSGQRGQIAEGLYYVNSEAFIPILIKLLRDPVEAIRSEATELAFREEKSLALVELPFNELERAGTPLQAHQLGNYYFSDLADTSGGKRLVGGWCRKVLADEHASVGTHVLACYGLANAWRSSDLELVSSLVVSESPWLRRAAWHLLGQKSSRWFDENVEQLLQDENPLVREALTEVSTRNRSSWKYAFSDTIQKTVYDYNSQRNRRKLSTSVETALRQMSEEDGDPRLQFEAYFSLLSHQREIDLKEFIALIPAQPAEPAVSERLASYFEDNRRRVGVGVKPLLAYADLEEISASSMDDLEKRLGKSGEENFMSFSSLSKAVEISGEQAVEIVEEEGAEEVRERESLSLVYFHKPGCKDCARVEDLLASMKKDFPLLKMEKYSIMEADATVLNQALCLRFGVPARQQTLTPAVFVQGGALIKEDISPSQLGGLLEETMELDEDNAWMEVGVEDLAAAEEKIEERFDALTLPVIIGAGLLDGINPCAFATIIFFLSYLQVAKRNAREILFIGMAFILAVFLTYFLVGLALHGVIEQIARFKGAQLVMTWVFAAFALVVAILSFRDGLKARKKGGIKDMSLQLPSFLKDRIRLVIRKGAKARNFVIAAFLSGVVISLLELACTGQVYAPIIFKIQQGEFDAVGYLVIYNLAFITPLVIIFGLAFGGMRSDTLISFQNKHTAAVKFGLAALFFALFLILVFQDRIL